MSLVVTKKYLSHSLKDSYQNVDQIGMKRLGFTKSGWRDNCWLQNNLKVLQRRKITENRKLPKTLYEI